MIFDESALEAYRSTKAPESLRGKVLEAAAVSVQKTQTGKVIAFRSLRSFAVAAAACLVLFLGVWGFFGGGVSVTTVHTDGGVSLAREIDVREFDFSVLQRGFCRLSVSCGEIELNGENATEFSVWGNGDAKWILPAGFDGEPELTIVRWGKTTVYRLVENADSGEFEICPAE